MQSENRVLRIAGRLVRSVGCSSASRRSYTHRSSIRSSFRAISPSVRPTDRPVGRPASWSAYAKRGASPAATSIRHFIRRAGGRARASERFVLERAKLKGFQFDKALSANFSSEQLTGINSHFFFHRSCPLPLALLFFPFRSPSLSLSLSFLLPCALARERRRTRERISPRWRPERPFARLLI